jgi:phage shock protein C
MALKTFTLDKRNAKMMGVCAGLARYFGIDATLVRIAVVLVTLAGAFPWTLIAYGLAALIAKPSSRADAELNRSVSTKDLRLNMRDIDRRMAEVEHYVTSSNSSLASEIEKLR